MNNQLKKPLTHIIMQLLLNQNQIQDLAFVCFFKTKEDSKFKLH